jgi:phosphinothricin acetyltransferase
VHETIVTFETELPTEDDLRARIERAHLWLVAEIEEVVGFAYAAPFHARPGYRWTVEVSIYLAEAARGRGLGRKLLTQLLDEITERGFVNAFAGVALPNDASVSLFESLGFKRVALQEKVGFKLGEWLDVGWWQRFLRPHDIPPPAISSS